MGKNPSTPSPRKTRARRSTTVASSLTPDKTKASVTRSAAKSKSAALSATGAIKNGTGTGTGIGRGRGRPRKTPVKESHDDSNNCTTAKACDGPDAVEPAVKKTRTDVGGGLSLSLSSGASVFEIQIPVRGLSRGKENIAAGNGMKIGNSGNGNDKSLPLVEEANLKLEDTEGYRRCGQEVDCMGGCCGEPRCLSCFGETKDSEFEVFN